MAPTMSDPIRIKELLIEEGLSADGIFKKVESLIKKLNN